MAASALIYRLPLRGVGVAHNGTRIPQFDNPVVGGQGQRIFDLRSRAWLVENHIKISSHKD